MKNSILIVLTMVLIFFAACMQNEQTDAKGVQITEQIIVPSAVFQPTVTPVATSNTTTVPTVTDKDWPEFDWAEPGEFIPDIVKEDEYASISNDTFYEDEESIYYLRPIRDDLICISKKDGEIKTIAIDCWDFAVNKGKVYYIDRNGLRDEGRYFNYIKVYDVKTETSKRLLKSEESIENLVCYKDKLFFTCTPNFDLNERGLVLFSANLDGTEVEKLGDDVDTFCIYQDNIYI